MNDTMIPCGAWELDQGDRGRIEAMLAACGADSSRLACLIHVGNPVPQARARSTRHGAHYTPAATRDAQARLARHMVELTGAGRGQWTGNLALVCIFYRDTARTVDRDNLEKLVLDAGTKAGVWRDDSQITGGGSVIELDRRNPRTVLALAPHTSTLRRDLVRVK